jgi:hypothetical protein
MHPHSRLSYRSPREVYQHPLPTCRVFGLTAILTIFTVNLLAYGYFGVAIAPWRHHDRYIASQICARISEHIWRFGPSCGYSCRLHFWH